MELDSNTLLWLDEHHEISLDDLRDLSGLTLDELNYLIEHGALTPSDASRQSWLFSSQHLVSLRSLSRLKVDFDLESEVLPLMLCLIDRIHNLELLLEKSNVKISNQ